MMISGRDLWPCGRSGAAILWRRRCIQCSLPSWVRVEGDIMKKGVIAAALAATLLFAGSAAAQIKIGFHAPQSGPAAAGGKSSTIGAEIARDWINEKGGVLGQKIELVIYDDQNKPDQAVPIANKLIGQDKVVAAVSGSYSAPTRAAAAVFQQSKIPYVA